MLVELRPTRMYGALPRVYTVVEDDFEPLKYLAKS